MKVVFPEKYLPKSAVRNDGRFDITSKTASAPMAGAQARMRSALPLVEREKVAIRTKKMLSRSATEVDLLARHEKGEKDRRKVFDPNSNFCQYWDMTISLLLIFTACVTPFEIGFFTTELNGLFFLNRIIDVGFACDIYINLKLAYFDRILGWVYDPAKCMHRYFKSWFWIDALALFPWDVLTFCVEAGSETSNVGEDGGANSALRRLKIMRLLKALKIAKLIRMAKGVRMFKQIATKANLSNRSRMLLKYSVVITMVTHWIACAWGLVARIQSEDKVHAAVYYQTDLGGRALKAEMVAPKSWIARAEEQLHYKLSTADIYAICLEYSLSIMCMGYGTVSPANPLERWFSVFCLFFAGSLYAYVVGGICAAVAAEDPAIMAFKSNMDMLMNFFRRHQIPDDMRIAAYDYMKFSRELLEDRMHQEVLQFMPPSIRSAITSELYGESLSKVECFNPKSLREARELQMGISLLLEPVAFPPNEMLYIVGDDAKCMYILQKGILQSIYLDRTDSFRVLVHGSVIGFEALECTSKRRESIKSLSFATCAKLDTDDMYTMLEKRPEAFKESRLIILTAALRSSLYACMRELGRAVMALQKANGQQRMTKEEMAKRKDFFKEKARLLNEQQRFKRMGANNESGMTRLKRRGSAAVSSIGAFSLAGSETSLAEVAAVQDTLKRMTHRGLAHYDIRARYGFSMEEAKGRFETGTFSQEARRDRDHADRKVVSQSTRVARTGGLAGGIGETGGIGGGIGGGVGGGVGGGLGGGNDGRIGAPGSKPASTESAEADVESGSHAKRESGEESEGFEEKVAEEEDAKKPAFRSMASLSAEDMATSIMGASGGGSTEDGGSSTEKRGGVQIHKGTIEKRGGVQIHKGTIMFKNTQMQSKAGNSSDAKARQRRMDQKMLQSAHSLPAAGGPAARGGAASQRRTTMERLATINDQRGGAPSSPSASASASASAPGEGIQVDDTLSQGLSAGDMLSLFMQVQMMEETQRQMLTNQEKIMKALRVHRGT
jgi:CRP-like cAMP-binding protein